MSSLSLVVLFLLGCAFGSFVNVLTLRFEPLGKFFSSRVVRGRSRCMSCKRQLRWFELVPLVSFVAQKGKCRSCRERLSWQYLLVELVGGLLFVFVPLALRSFFVVWNPAWGLLTVSFLSALWVAVFVLLLIVIIVDMRHFIIPNGINALLALLGVVWVLAIWRLGVFDVFYGGSFLQHYAALLPSPIGGGVLSYVFGALAGVIFFGLLVFLSRGRAMGMGDVKLIGALGLLFGWPDILLIIILSFLLGALVSVVLMLRGTKTLSDRVPFGPFIVLAATIVFFCGAGLMGAYFGIIGM